MKSIYQKHLDTAKKIQNHSEKLTYLTSVLRSLLQTAVISSFEITKNLTPSDEVDLSTLTDRFCKPSDGLPLQILDTLTPIIRCFVSKGYLNGWFEPRKNIKTPLSKQLITWVEFRNKRPGHGVLDTQNMKDWSTKTENIIRDCLVIFSDILPAISTKGELLPLKKFEGTQILTPVYTVVVQ